MNNTLCTCRLLCIAAIFLCSHLAIAKDGKNINKNYHITQPKNQNIDIDTRLSEASGLALSHSNESLWTVSDNKENLIFKMTLQGDAKDYESFEVVNFPYDRPDLEGIALSADGDFMYLAQERDFAILKINFTAGSDNAVLVDHKKLSDMAGYQHKIDNIYNGIKKSKGLEGITVHTGTNEIFVLIEQVTKNSTKGPLLVKISNNLQTIIDVNFLNEDTGFVSEDGNANIDGSGIDYDRTDTSKNRFYIVSDKGERVFHYDWDSNHATPAQELGFENGEGVVYDPATERLYVVTDGGDDEDSRLYSYQKQ
jgi:uncharacterized protein YjiK